MLHHTKAIVAFLAAVALAAVCGKCQAEPLSRFQALQCPVPSQGSTWAILQRDGAGRKVQPYLSSLGQGESGTGVISSPPFTITTDAITFTICGHDGQTGGRGENYIALVDARKGKVLLRTPPPQNDAMQQRRWDVRPWRGQQVRVEVHDGNNGRAFAWLGVGRIDAGNSLRVGFRQGIPRGWLSSEQATEAKYDVLTGGVPFRRNTSIYSVIPQSGSVEIPCGFTAKRVFFLGCTVAGGKSAETYGGIELHYRTGSPEVIPLLCGFTLEAQYKLPSRSPAMHLHATSDPFQYYLVVEPRDEVIEKIRLVANPQRTAMPRITAITCETRAQNEHLLPLPTARLLAEERAWIASHAISARSLELGAIVDAIRAANKMPPDDGSSVRFVKHQLDAAFRSEGVAVADLNGDGHLDIAAGSVYYTGPDWQPVPLLGEPRQFNRYGYSEAFLCFADDVNGDGAVDLVEVGFPGRETYWLENPSRPGAVWNRHLAIARTGNESPWYGDVDGDGRRELVFMSQGRCSLARPGEDPAAPWAIHPIAGAGDPAPAHGLGVGDINGDGRPDIVVPNGWWEQPKTTGQIPWPFHEAELFGGAQLCVADLNGDGRSDVLGTSAHGYGIAWNEQTADGWKTHRIDESYSQTHAVALADLNGDGLVDFVTGKRPWAHNGHDPGSFEPAWLYWYEQTRSGKAPKWIRHRIDVGSGVGLHLVIADLNGDRLPDLVTANKNGVFYFRQTRPR